MENQIFSSVYGKETDTVELKNKLTGLLIGLARATVGNEDLLNTETYSLVIESLSANDNENLTVLIDRVTAEKNRLAPNCMYCTASCGKNDNYDMQKLWNAERDVRSLKSLILLGIRGVATYAYRAGIVYPDESIMKFFFKALFAIGMDDWGMNELLSIALELGEINLKCMALPDQSNT